MTVERGTPSPWVLDPDEPVEKLIKLQAAYDQLAGTCELITNERNELIEILRTPAKEGAYWEDRLQEYRALIGTHLHREPVMDKTVYRVNSVQSFAAKYLALEDELDHPIAATPAEAKELFDSVCQHYLSMPGDEFLKQWNDHKITRADGEKDHRISRVIAMLPFAAHRLPYIESIAKLEAALQSVIDYEPFCLQAQGQETGMCMFECPTCVARKALGGMEMEETARLGRGEDPRTFGQEDKP